MMTDIEQLKKDKTQAMFVGDWEKYKAICRKIEEMK
jgi:hypothetical protein